MDKLGGTRIMDNVIIYDKLEELNEGIEYNGGHQYPIE